MIFTYSSNISWLLIRNYYWCRGPCLKVDWHLAVETDIHMEMCRYPDQNSIQGREETMDSAWEELSGRLVHRKQCLGWIMKYEMYMIVYKQQRGEQSWQGNEHKQRWQCLEGWLKCCHLKGPERNLGRRVKWRAREGTWYQGWDLQTKGPMGKASYITLRILTGICKIHMNRI